MFQQPLFHRLLAKSWNAERDGPPPAHIFLPQHLRDVGQAANAIVDATSESQLSAFGLPLAEWSERFRRTVLLAAVTHDLGKANDQFLGMVTGHVRYRKKRQGLRHEWITWLILQADSWKLWLSSALCQHSSEIDWSIALWAITGHHPAYHRESPPSKITPGSNDGMHIFLGHHDFSGCMDAVRDCLEIGSDNRPVCEDLHVSLHGALDQIADWTAKQKLLWEKWRRATELPALSGYIAAVKNCVVAADVAGSALPRQGEYIDRSIASGFARTPGRENLSSLICHRLTDDNTGVVHELRPFQRRVAECAGDVTLVTAGCGSGKTLAAYHWAREHHPDRRLYLCYPTTGTATEGFRDYVFDSVALTSKFGAKLFHGRAGVDLQLILGVYDRTEDEESDVLARIDALEAWSTPIVTCTADTVLGVMQNHRRGIYSWPALAGSAFVFDEIHAFDGHLFGALLRFIRELRGVPILLMTASLPEQRLDQLRAAAKSRGAELTEIGGPDELELLPRYHSCDVSDIEAIVDRVRIELRSNSPIGKVLWVTNTVNRAIEAAERCRDFSPIVYHSRFRYVDRVERHKQVIERFRDRSQPALAICTQVAEMSLDLSATLLITELAPIPALIQRLGRLNRRAKTAKEPTQPFIVYEPRDKEQQISPLPYDALQLAFAAEWLKRLPKVATQRDLICKWREMDTDQGDDRVCLDSTWLDGAFRRDVKELRCGAHGISVVMEEDARRIFARQEELVKVAIPMTQPKTNKWRDWPVCFGIPIAPNDYIRYDNKLGATWIA